MKNSIKLPLQAQAPQNQAQKPLKHYHKTRQLSDLRHLLDENADDEDFLDFCLLPKKFDEQETHLRLSLL